MPLKAKSKLELAMDAEYKGPPEHANYDRPQRGNYPVSKTYSRDEEKLERLKNEAIYNYVMESLGPAVLADFGDSNDFQSSERAAFEAKKVELVLRNALGLSIRNPKS